MITLNKTILYLTNYIMHNGIFTVEKCFVNLIILHQMQNGQLIILKNLVMTHMPEQYKGLQMRNNSELRQLVDFSTYGDVATSFRTRLIAYVIEKYNDFIRNIPDIELNNFYNDLKNAIKTGIRNNIKMAHTYNTFNIETKLFQLTNYEII